MELNREEIIKALECCLGGAICAECPNVDLVDCFRQMQKNALSLIKELTKEVEGLKQCLEHEHASFIETFGEWNDKCEKLTEENERLKDNFIKQTIENIRLLIENQEIKADTVRKMQERLRAEKFHHMNFGDLVYLEDIDRISKELLAD